MAAEKRRWQATDEPQQAAAELVAQALATSSQPPRLAVAGGSAAAVLEPLRKALTTDQWQQLRVTWVDERRVPSDSPDSNRGETYRRGWLGPSAQVGLEVPLWLDRETPEAAVRRVSQTLTEEFEAGLDVLLLGMGEDGHVASLFPNHPALKADGIVALVDDSPKPPPERITLTLGFLSTAPCAILVAAGSGKRDALRRLREGDPSLPVARLPHLTVVTNLTDI